MQERQRIAAAEGDDADVFGYHYENGMLAVNLFHMRGGRVVDRREFFWEDLPEFASPPDVESSCRPLWGQPPSRLLGPSNGSGERVPALSASDLSSR